MNVTNLRNKLVNSKETKHVITTSTSIAERHASMLKLGFVSINYVVKNVGAAAIIQVVKKKIY